MIRKIKSAAFLALAVLMLASCTAGVKDQEAKSLKTSGEKKKHTPEITYKGSYTPYPPETVRIDKRFEGYTFAFVPFDDENVRYSGGRYQMKQKTADTFGQNKISDAAAKVRLKYIIQAAFAAELERQGVDITVISENYVPLESDLVISGQIDYVTFNIYNEGSVIKKKGPWSWGSTVSIDNIEIYRAADDKILYSKDMSVFTRIKTDSEVKNPAKTLDYALKENLLFKAGSPGGFVRIFNETLDELNGKLLRKKLTPAEASARYLAAELVKDMNKIQLPAVTKVVY